RKGYFDPAGVTAAAANPMDELQRKLRRGRLVEDQLCAGPGRLGQQEPSAFVIQTDTSFPEFFRDEFGRQRHALVPVNKQVNTAPRAASRNAHQALAGGVAEPGWEIRNDQEVIFFRDDTGLLVVFGDSLVFVTQVHLNDLLHVLIQVSQSLINLAAL